MTLTLRVEAAHISFGRSSIRRDLTIRFIMHFCEMLTVSVVSSFV